MRHIRFTPLRLVGVLFGALLVLSACEPVYTQAAVDSEETDPETLPWWCDSTGGGHGDHEMDPDPYEGVVKGELTWGECKTNSIWFDMAVDYAQQWPTAGEAEADGWHQVVPYAQGMGTHHMRGIGEGIDDVFEGGRPEFLMYDGNGPDAELTGMAWWVRSEGGPPEGFKGDNDWWHQHPNVCLSQKLTWIGQGISEEDCEAMGGIHLPNDDMWMAHAWIMPDWQLHFDVFQNHHPCLPWGGPITDPDHACWDEAMHGSGHGH
ncbi:MAG: hypothetical protein U5K30_17510 [Acidimicrobiales bacterium]|nr:hypothetical protein [Acidimicrobiales bacterium]